MMHMPTRWKAQLDDHARACLVQGIVGYYFQIAPDDLRDRNRGRAPVAFARQVAMYLTHIAFEMSLNRVAAAFGRDRTTVSHACHLVEDRRDDPDFDATLTELESLILAVPEPRSGASASPHTPELVAWS